MGICVGGAVSVAVAGRDDIAIAVGSLNESMRISDDVICFAAGAGSL